MNEPIGCALCGGNDHNADECKRFAGDLVLDRGWPDRDYWCKCCGCGEMFTGHKRQMICRVCTEESAAQPAPVVPEGWNIQRVFNPSGYTIQMPSGGFIRITDHGGGGVETAFCQFVAASLSAEPAQGHQVDHIEQDLGMAQHARDSAELRRLCAERDEAKRQVAALRQHKTDYMEAAEVTRKALESELSALKAQQVGQEPVAGGVCVTSCRSEEGITVGLVDTIINSARLLSNRNLGGAAAEALRDMRSDSDVCGLFTSAPQPAPAQDVAGLLEWAVDRWHAEVANRPLQNVHRRSLDDTWRQVIRKLGGDAGLLCGPAHDALAAHDKQSGEVKP